MTPMCAVRNHPIPAGDPWYGEVRAWEKPGRGVSGQSGSSLVLREPTGRVACSKCITRLQNGLSPDQEPLV